MRLGKIGLLFLILATGVTLEAAYRIRESIDLGPLGWRILRGRFSGPSFTFTDTIRPTLPHGATVEITNSFGRVAVARGTGKDAVVRLDKVVFESTEGQARAFADRIKLEHSLSGSVLRVSTNRAGLPNESDWDVGFETNLTVEVPEGTAVNVENEHGDVDVADATAVGVVNSHGQVSVARASGAIDVRSEHGDVRAEGIEGAAKISLRHGDAQVSDVKKEVAVEVDKGDAVLNGVASLDASVQHGELRAEQVEGDATVRGAHVEVDMTDVGGRAVVETAYRDVTLNRIKGEATVRSSHGAVSVREIGGATFIEAGYGDVSVNDVAGPVEISVDHGSVAADGVPRGAKIRSPGGDVKLERFAGPVSVESERGSVSLSPASGIVDAITATTRYGNVELAVPDGSRFDLDASSDSGEVSVDNLSGFAGTTATSDEEHQRRAAGKVGGGGKPVLLSATRGEVIVRSDAGRGETARTP